MCGVYQEKRERDYYEYIIHRNNTNKYSLFIANINIKKKRKELKEAVLEEPKEKHIKRELPKYENNNKFVFAHFLSSCGKIETSTFT